MSYNYLIGRSRWRVEADVVYAASATAAAAPFDGVDGTGGGIVVRRGHGGRRRVRRHVGRFHAVYALKVVIQQ